MTQVAVVVSVLVFAGFVAWISERHRIRLKQVRFTDRDVRSVESMVECYFESKVNHDKLVFWWNYVAHILKIDPRKLRPNDRFDDQLAPDKGFFLIEDEMLQLDDLIDELNLSKERSALNRTLDTVGELVEFLAVQEMTGNSENPR